MKWLKKHGVTLFLVAVMVIGLCLLLYPTLSNYWNSLHQSQMIASYAEAVADIDNTTYEEMMQSARDYNIDLAQRALHWELTPEEQEAYEAELDISGMGVMGYIEIDKIHCSLPIYHGTDETVLQIAVGHIGGTSLPVGGENTHAVLSGHRGLPSAKLFSDLDKMNEGDTFVIRVLDETMTYMVDQIRIVEPTDLSSLTIEKGQDLVTLVTCTPYGINTHRLLVRGHRVENAATAKEIRVTADAMQIEPIIVAPVVAVPLLIILLIAFMALTKRR